MGRTLLFLDFDGVVCDSIDECFVSSWVAFHRMHGAPLPGCLAIELRARFAGLRPFIRSGEDYVAIQRLLAADRRVSSQEQFDAVLAEEGPGGMERLKDEFYAARSGLLQSDRAYWLSLNRVYPHVRGPLAAIASREDALILSTKKSEFIVEILAANGIAMPAGRVLTSGSRSKADIIGSMLGPADRALLVDDQIDHLLACCDARIDVRLAMWGYIKPEWPAQHPGVPLAEARTFEALLGPWLTPSRREGA